MRYIFAGLLFPLWIIPALVCGFFKDAGVVSDPEAEEETRQELIKLLQELHGDEWVKYAEDFQ
jgi:hypothetical protein